MRKIFTLLLLTLLLPAVALAEGKPAKLVVGGTDVKAGGYWTTGQDGKLTSTTDTENYNVHYDKDSNTLTLNNATISGSGNSNSLTDNFNAAIYAAAASDQSVSLTIVLKDKNTVEAPIGIFVNSTGSSTATLTITSNNDGTLEASYSDKGIWVNSNYRNASLNIRNATVTAECTNNIYGYGIDLRAGENAKASLTVIGGQLTATGNGENGAGIRYTFGGGTSDSGAPSLTVGGNAIVKANNSNGGGIVTNSSTTNTVSPNFGIENGGIVFDKGTGTVYGNVTLPSDLTIGEGESLDIPSWASLTIPNGTTLTVNGGTLTGNIPTDGVIYKVTGVSLSSNTLTLDVGESEALTATITPSNATDKSVTWESSDTNVAIVENGTVTAVGVGSTTITATAADGSGEYATCTVTVSKDTPTFDEWTVTDQTYDGDPITITPPTLNDGTITEGITLSYKGKEEGDEAYTKNAPTNAGNYTVKAYYAGDDSYNSATTTAEFSIIPAQASLSYSATTIEKQVGDEPFVNMLTNEANMKVAYSSTNPDVATVDDTGKVTLIAAGTTTITATDADTNYDAEAASYVLTVNKKEIEEPEPPVIPDYPDYYNIYVDECEGVTVETSANVVREGNSMTFTINVEEGYTDENMIVKVKRSLFGYSDIIKPNEDGIYELKNIYTEIYITVDGVEEVEEPTGIGDVESTKVYAKDGSIYVQTPQLETVTIISISGEVRKQEELIGLQRYDLPRGIYIICIGEERIKVRN